MPWVRLAMARVRQPPPPFCRCPLRLGHGDTTVDSHLALPAVTKTWQELWDVELVPFRAAVQANVSGIMTAHIVFPKVCASRTPKGARGGGGGAALCWWPSPPKEGVGLRLCP